MKRLIAAVASVAVVLGGMVGLAPAASAASSWDYSGAQFTLTDALKVKTATASVTAMRVTGSSATGRVTVSDGGRYSCSTQNFSGLTANFLTEQYSPCTGTVTFAVDASGVLTVSDSGLTMPSLLLVGPGQGTATGTPYPRAASCTASKNGATGVRLSISDSGTGAPSYTVTVSPAPTGTTTPTLPLTVLSPATSSAAVTADITGLDLGTDYTFTVTPVGGSGDPGTCSMRTDERPKAPVGAATLGAITGATEASAEQEVTLTAAPETGWNLEWTRRSDGATVTSPIPQACKSIEVYVPSLVRSDAPTIVGADVEVTATCTLPTPKFVQGTISGSNVTVNFAIPGAVLPGTEVWAQWRASGSKPDQAVKVLLGPGSSAGAGSFAASGLKPLQSVYVRLFTRNGPISSPPSGESTIPGEVPPLSYSTIVTGTQDGTTARPSVPNTVDLSAIRTTSFSFSVAPGEALPTGLKVDPYSGVVQANGQPLAAFDGSVTIRLMDFAKRAVYAPVRIQIAPAPPAPEAVTYADVVAVVGNPVTSTPRIGSALTGYYFSPDLCTRFPGLSLNNRSGVISGTPTLPVAAQKLTVTVSKNPGTACGAPQGAAVTSTKVSLQVSLAPQAFAISYAQSSVTALVGSIIPDDVPTPTPAGQTGLTYAVTGGLLPAGLTLDPATGVISGIATTQVTASKVSVTASQAQPSRTATTDVTFTILSVPSGGLSGLVYPDVPRAPVGVPMAVMPTGTVSGQTFALDAASTKAGLSIEPATGRITWTPTARQRGTRTVTVTVSAGGTSTTLTPFTITVVAAAATQQPTNTGGSGSTSSAGAATGSAGGSSGSSGATGAASPCLAPDGTLYTDFHGSAASTLTMAPNTIGLPAPVSFTVTKGSLPRGVWLDGSVGVISGTPERSNGGDGAVEITTTWADGTVRVSDFTIGIDDPHHAVNYPNRIIGTIGEGVAVTPFEVNPVGTSTYQVVCGALSPGLALDAATGVISGTPTALVERPVPLRVRMTDSYGWVDSSFIIVVDPGVTPWLRYPEFAEIGYGRTVSIVPTRSGLPSTDSYRITGELPPGLKLNRKTGVISGIAKVRDGYVYEPTIAAIAADGSPQATTVPSMTVIKPAVPMKVTARTAAKRLKSGATIVVTKVRHPAYSSLSARVVCSGCAHTFSKKTGRLVVKAGKRTTKVTVTVTASPRGAKARAAYAGHQWTRTWRVAR